MSAADLLLHGWRRQPPPLDALDRDSVCVVAAVAAAWGIVRTGRRLLLLFVGVRPLPLPR